MARLAFLALVFLIPAAPAAALERSATVSPDTVVFPVTREVTYRVTVRTLPGEPSRYTVHLDEPWFDPTGDLLEEGVALRLLGVRHEGAGELRVGHVDPGISPHCTRPHGYGFERTFYELTVPPLAEATIVATYAPPLFARWPATDLSLAAFVTAGGSDEGYTPSPSPRLEGPRGIRLRVRLRAGAHTATTLPAPAVLDVGAGDVVNVNGSADPLPRRVAVRLRPRDPIGRTRTIARPRLRRNGRFFTRVRAPRRPGLYEIYAAAPGDRTRGLVGDASCGRQLRVR